MTALLIEDDDTYSYMFARTMKQHGIDVMRVDNGRTGLELLQQTPLDFVVTDLKLPEISGFEVLQRLQHRRFQSKVFLVSVDCDPACGSLAVSYGATAAYEKGDQDHMEKIIREVAKTPAP